MQAEIEGILRGQPREREECWLKTRGMRMQDSRWDPVTLAGIWQWLSLGSSALHDIDSTLEHTSWDKNYPCLLLALGTQQQ
jgi:hypothetical protein